MRKISIILTLLVVTQQLSLGQLIVSGEYRPRTEFDHGYKKLAAPNSEALIYTSQRTRINFDYSNEFISAKLSLQDIRIWGSQPQLNTTDGLLSLHEGWVQVKFCKTLSVKAGRQEVIYDDHRIFGNVGWAQQARSHDMAILKFNDSGLFSADLGIAYNQNTIPSNPFSVTGNYKALQYLWLHKELSDKLGISLLLLNNGNQLTTKIDSINNSYSIIYSQTAGGRITSKPHKNIGINAAFYYQTGKDAANKDLSAYFASADISAQLLQKKLTLSLGYELLSGTDQNSTNTSVNNSFTPFYGTNHKFNGHMDYFYVGNHLNSVGLQDIFVQTSYKIKKFIPGFDFHIFNAPSVIYDKSMNKTFKSSLGQEIDLFCNYKLNDIVTFSGGYSQMFATESLEFLRGGSADEISNWIWFMLSVNPKFYIEKKEK